MPSRLQTPPAVREARLVGRLAAEPEPAGAGMILRVVVTYGIERHERRVLARGSGAKAARQLRASDLAYVVGRRANDGGEHEIEAEHVLALEPVERKEVPVLLPF